MNSRPLRIALVALLVAAAFALGWARFAGAGDGAPRGNLAGASIGGAFDLIDQNGRRVTDRDFAGRYRLMYFGYTSCPDVCPTDVAALAKGLIAFERNDAARAAKVAPIFVTVDPERDTPPALKQFVAAFHPRLIGLTGPPKVIDAVRQRYGIYARKAPGADPANYLVDHFAVTYLFGPAGEPIAFVQHGAAAPEIAAMLEAHVR